MSRMKGISLIIGVLLLACIVQSCLADPDLAVNGTGNQTEVTATPVTTVTPDTAVNASDTQPAVTVTPVVAATPDTAVNTSDTQPAATVTPVVAATPDTAVNTSDTQPAVTVTPVVAATPDTAVNASDAQPAVTVTPVVTATPDTTVNVTGAQQGPSLAPMNPAFSQYLVLSLMGKAPSVGQGHSLGYVPPSVDLSYLKGRAVSWASVDSEAEAEGTDLMTQDAQTAGYPAVYDLRILGKVTPVRDQGLCGACWAFATYGSLESTLLPRETWDFSENNMLNTNGYDMGHCGGGNDLIAMAYLARWSGPVNEQADPYSVSALFSPPDLKTRKHAQQMYIIPQRNDPTDNSNIKAAIMNYGGVYSALVWDGGSSFNTTYAAYYGENGYEYWPNHAITLVGWDDTFSASKFLAVQQSNAGTTYVSMPPGDGAFIAKNSWGTGFGDKGYFYISYYDPQIGFTSNAVFTAEPLKNLKQIYQYDDLGWIGSLGFGSDTAWFANVFRALDRSSVSAVSFYTATENSGYTVSVYTDPPDDGPINQAGPMATKSGSFELAGYHTVNLDPPVLVNLGQKFSVVVKLNTPGIADRGAGPIPVEVQIPGYSSKVVIHPGVSFESADGSSWTDITEIQLDPVSYPNIQLGNVDLKAFTVPAIPPPDARFTATPKLGKVPLKVTFRDRSLRRPSSWSWDFGDGTTSTDRNPVHTYTTAGTFTVNLTVKNNGGSDFTTKEAYVTVGASKGKARPYFDFHKQDDDNTPANR
jgi:C1A family cysteine protease